MTNDRILEIAVEVGLWYSDSTDSDAKMLIAFARAVAAESARQTATAAKAIHYPECWDTAAYPTLKSALEEVYASFKCSDERHIAKANSIVGPFSQ